MYLQTLISVLVWVGVLFSTSMLDTMSDLEKSELAHKLNMLVNHSGWRFIDVKTYKKKRTEIADPISEILEAISLNQMPVDQTNVLERHNDIATVLTCKYSEIIFNYKALVNHFIRVCQNEKNWSNSFKKFYSCFNLLLTKLHSMSVRFRCMMDALDFVYSLFPLRKSKYKGIGVMDATRKLTEYTLTIGPTISSKLSTQGTTVDVVDLEMNSISEYISEIYNKNIYRFNYLHCIIPANRKWTANTITDFLIQAKSIQQIPQETTMLQYLIDEIDSYVNDILSKWFYDLGFAYGVKGIVKIGTSKNMISPEVAVE